MARLVDLFLSVVLLMACVWWNSRGRVVNPIAVAGMIYAAVRISLVIDRNGGADA